MLSMKSDNFHLVTVNDGKSDNIAIVKVFSEIAAGRLKCDLTLLNYCGEVLVSYESTITTADNDSVELKVHEHQALIIKHDKYTIIKSEHFHNGLGVHCYAKSVNLPKNTIILHNFAYAQIRPERRETYRVTVSGSQPVRFSCENDIIEGSMVDISESVISINSRHVTAMKTDQSGILCFALNGTPLAVPGSLVKTTPNGTGGHICIFQMMPDSSSGSIIEQFICQRQAEIIQKLNVLFTA